MINSRYVAIDDLHHYPYPIVFRAMLDTGMRETADISYDEERCLLYEGDKKLSLTSGSLEHYFCRVLFQCAPGVSVSWDELADEMDSCLSDSKDRLAVKQCIKDVKRRLNAKIAQTFKVADYFSSRNSEYYRQ